MYIYSAILQADIFPFIPQNWIEESLLISDAKQMTGNQPGILVLWGGEDISPSYYKQTPNSYSGAQAKPSMRDTKEVLMIKRAVDLKMPIIGICRGAQLLCAVSGGKLIQHVNRHGSEHLITTNDGAVMNASSAHHQMLSLEGTKHELIAWATNRATLFIGEDDEMLPPQTEVEIAYFPKIKALAIQPHPEWMGIDTELNKYLRKLVKEKFGE